MQSQGVQVIEDQTSFIALLLMLGMASYLGSAYSVKPKSNPVGNPGERELLKEFNQLNPEAQRGAIRYIKQMRKGYQKVKGPA